MGEGTQPWWQDKSTTLTTVESSFCLPCGLSTLCPSCDVVCIVGSTLFLLLRGSPSTRSNAACLFTEVTDVEPVNHAGSLGCFRTASGLVDLGGLGIEVGTDIGMDMDMVVNFASRRGR